MYIDRSTTCIKQGKYERIYIYIYTYIYNVCLIPVINCLLLPHCSEDQHYILSDISIYIIKTGSYFPLCLFFVCLLMVYFLLGRCDLYLLVYIKKN